MNRLSQLTGWIARQWKRFWAWYAMPGPRSWRRVALLGPFILIMFLGVGYTNYVQRQADGRWCELITILDVQYQSVPPDNPIAIRFANAIHDLRENLDC